VQAAHEDRLEAKPALIGAGLVCCGVAAVELLLAAGWNPLGPLGVPGLFLVLAGAFWGASAAIGGAAVMFGYLIYSLGAPHRFPHFFNNPGMLAFWVLGFGVVTSVAVLLRARMKRAHAQALEAANNQSEMAALMDYRQWLNSLIDNAPALIGYIDAEQRYTFHNRTYEHWLDKSKAEITGRTVREVFGEAEYQKIRPHLERALRGGIASFHHEHLQHGEVRHAQTTFAPDFDRGGAVRGCFVVAKDIGATIAGLRASQQRTELALDGSNIELWDADLQSGKVSLADKQLTLQALAALVHPDDLAAVRASLRSAVKGLAPAYVAEHRVRTARGEWRWILSRGRVTQRDPASGRALRMIGANVDIQERKLAELALERRAEAGPDITGSGSVASQSLLVERLRRALARSQRSGAPLALLHLEPQGAEAVLTEVAARLRGCVRVTDTVVRVGADQFVVMLEGLKERSDAFRVAEKMLQALRTPLTAGGGEVRVTASIGVAFPEGTEAAPEELVKRAGAALSAAKNAGRNAYRSG
jgi:PAS domain S-box-containing protein